MGGRRALICYWLLLLVAVVEVQPGCVSDDIRWRSGRTISRGACGQCTCVELSHGVFSWSCSNENDECQKDHPRLKCHYVDQVMDAGDSMPKAKDSCGNTCTCEIGGNVACTNFTCPPPAQNPTPRPGCSQRGISRAIGEIWFPNPRKRCHSCECLPSGIVDCADSCAQCYYNDQRLSVGESVTASDGCNTCTCRPEGRMECTEDFCGSFHCEFEGRIYQIGEVFRRPGDCNLCDCGVDGTVACASGVCPDLAPPAPLQSIPPVPAPAQPRPSPQDPPSSAPAPPSARDPSSLARSPVPPKTPPSSSQAPPPPRARPPFGRVQVQPSAPMQAPPPMSGAPSPPGRRPSPSPNASHAKPAAAFELPQLAHDIPAVDSSQRIIRRNNTCIFEGRSYRLGEQWVWHEGAGPEGPEGAWSNGKGSECDKCTCVRDFDRTIKWVCTPDCTTTVSPEQQQSRQQTSVWSMIKQLLAYAFSRSSGPS